MGDADKASIDTLITALKRCFSPSVDREKFYREVEEHRLRPAEDPNLFLWRLKESLRNAEPHLSDTAFDALLRCQFMKGLPQNLQLKLLEYDPTPTLATMTSFAQRFRSVQSLPLTNAACAAITAPPMTNPETHQSDRLLQQQQQLDNQKQQLDTFGGLLSQLAEGQQQIMK